MRPHSSTSPSSEQESPPQVVSDWSSQGTSTQGPGSGLSPPPELASGLQERATQDNANEKARATTATACLACRNKHLKCDGGKPCSRCTSFGSECVYVASRRGYKGPRRATAKNPHKRMATSSPDREYPGSASICPSGGSSTKSGSSPGYSLGSDSTPSSIIAHRNDTPSFNGLFFETCSQPAYNNTRPPLPSLAERCFDSFYQNFHAAHPFVLPKDYIHSFSGEGLMEPLLAAMRWVGSLFIDVSSARESLFDEAVKRIYNPSNCRDAFLVQAMLLVIIGLDGMCQQEKARKILEDVEKLAVDIALNTRPFAKLYGKSFPVLEESWRRTWWDLYVVDGMIAGVHQKTNFALFDVPADVDLPCEELEYLTGNIPPPRGLIELDEKDFTDDDREFSSFAYRILCTRNLGTLFRSPPMLGPSDNNLMKIESLLTNWRLHLPVSKQDSLNRDGHLDEMMFQAHMMAHATSIILHRPHSQLDTSSTESIDSCAPHQAVATGKDFNTHTRHTISSADEISKLITHRVPLLSHSHFFTCVITLSSTIHLSKWGIHFMQYDDDDLRQQIRLNIGALNELSHVWSAAETAKGEVQAVARRVYQNKKKLQAPQFWQPLGLTEAQVAAISEMDESIINAAENRQP